MLEEQGTYEKSLMPSQFYCESQTALKKNSYFLKEKRKWQLEKLGDVPKVTCPLESRVQAHVAPAPELSNESMRPTWSLTELRP